MDEWQDIIQKRSEPTQIQISVTNEHIRKGNRHNYIFDPIALAIREQLTVSWAAAGWYHINTFQDDIKTSYYIASADSKRVSAWIKDWDRGKFVQPISFSIIKEKSVDKAPKASKRKPNRWRNFTEEQMRLQLK